MNTFASNIIEITSSFVDNETDEKLLSRAASRYKELLLQQVDINPDNPVNQQHIYRSNGKAVSVNTAVSCLTDHARTKKFISGTYQAIASLLKKGKKDIRVLYAGTGPFAAILLPSMLKFREENIHYTLMDINHATLKNLRLILSKLELDDDRIQIVCADATVYKIEPGQGFDVIISETMQASLAREQQVSVFLNLMRQSPEETIFIPEKIEVFLGLRTIGLINYELTRHNCTEITKVFEVSKGALKLYLNRSNPPTDFPNTRHTINQTLMNNSDLLLLMTKIQIFGDQALHRLESHLTEPIIIDNIIEKCEQDILVELQYKTDFEPMFKFQIT